MVPTPSDIEKNACPRAQAHPDAPSLERSGLSRYFTPSAEPGSDTENTTIATISTKSSGIVILVKRSIPFFTPPSTISDVAARKAKSINTDSAGEDAIRPKIAVASSGRPWARCPVRALPRKSRLHPPTTE